MYKKDIKTFTIALLGDSGVGKDTIINIYNDKQFDDNIASTLGMRFSYKEMIVNKKDKIILKLVDTVGQEKYRSLAKSYFKNIDAVLFVFSMDDKDSFDTIKDWMELFKSNNAKEGEIPKYLVGNKNDLEKKFEQSLIDEFAKENNIPYISTSAKDNNNIDELFKEIGKKLNFDYQQKGDIGQTNLEVKIIRKKKKNNCCIGPEL